MEAEDIDNTAIQAFLAKESCPEEEVIDQTLLISRLVYGNSS